MAGIAPGRPGLRIQKRVLALLLWSETQIKPHLLIECFPVFNCSAIVSNHSGPDIDKPSFEIPVYYWRARYKRATIFLDYLVKQFLMSFLKNKAILNFKGSYEIKQLVINPKIISKVLHFICKSSITCL